MDENPYESPREATNLVGDTIRPQQAPRHILRKIGFRGGIACIVAFPLLIAFVSISLSSTSLPESWVLPILAGSVSCLALGSTASLVAITIGAALDGMR